MDMKVAAAILWVTSFMCAAAAVSEMVAGDWGALVALLPMMLLFGWMASRFRTP